MEKAKRMGIEAYRAEQRAKVALLHRLLDGYDNGTRDVFFCLTANMLEVGDLETARARMDAATADMDAHAKADYAEGELRRIAAERDVPLELRAWSGLWD